MVAVVAAFARLLAPAGYSFEALLAAALKLILR